MNIDVDILPRGSGKTQGLMKIADTLYGVAVSDKSPMHTSNMLWVSRHTNHIARRYAFATCVQVYQFQMTYNKFMANSRGREFKHIFFDDCIPDSDLLRHLLKTTSEVYIRFTPQGIPPKYFQDFLEEYFPELII